MKAMKKILGDLRKADNDFNLIQDNDRILVGVSGGKDSNMLLYALSLYKKFEGKNFEVIGVFLDVGFGPSNIDELIQWFSEKGVKIIKYPTQIYEILQLHKKENGMLQCSLCSRLRKGAIINAAKELGCNKFAYGHHNDDAVETLFMNMIHGGRIATFLPDMYLSESDIHLLRPLIYCYESDIEKAVNQIGIPIVKSGCPNNEHTERENIKNLTKEIYHKFNCRDNFKLMLRNQKQLEIFKPIENDDQ